MSDEISKETVTKDEEGVENGTVCASVVERCVSDNALVASESPYMDDDYGNGNVCDVNTNPPDNNCPSCFDRLHETSDSTEGMSMWSLDTVMDTVNDGAEEVAGSDSYSCNEEGELKEEAELVEESLPSGLVDCDRRMTQNGEILISRAEEQTDGELNFPSKPSSSHEHDVKTIIDAILVRTVADDGEQGQESVPECNLAVETDGQHYEGDLEKQAKDMLGGQDLKLHQVEEYKQEFSNEDNETSDRATYSPASVLRDGDMTPEDGYNPSAACLEHIQETKFVAELSTCHGVEAAESLSVGEVRGVVFEEPCPHLEKSTTAGEDDQTLPGYEDSAASCLDEDREYVISGEIINEDGLGICAANHLVLPSGNGLPTENTSWHTNPSMGEMPTSFEESQLDSPVEKETSVIGSDCSLKECGSLSLPSNDLDESPANTSSPRVRVIHSVQSTENTGLTASLQTEDGDYPEAAAVNGVEQDGNQASYDEVEASSSDLSPEKQHVLSPCIYGEYLESQLTEAEMEQVAVQLEQMALVEMQKHEQEEVLVLREELTRMIDDYSNTFDLQGDQLSSTDNDEARPDVDHCWVPPQSENVSELLPSRLDICENEQGGTVLVAGEMIQVTYEMDTVARDSTLTLMPDQCYNHQDDVGQIALPNSFEPSQETQNLNTEITRPLSDDSGHSQSFQNVNPLLLPSSCEMSQDTPTINADALVCSPDGVERARASLSECSGREDSISTSEYARPGESLACFQSVSEASLEKGKEEQS